jgi:hypothetical protein
MYANRPIKVIWPYSGEGQSSEKIPPRDRLPTKTLTSADHHQANAWRRGHKGRIHLENAPHATIAGGFLRANFNGPEIPR